MLNIIFLCGKICSGKGHYYREHMQEKGWDQIIVSNIVRRLISNSDRNALQDTADLDVQIADSLIARINQYEGRGLIVVDGIRQHSIIQHIELAIPTANYKYIWLATDYSEREQRYMTRAADKDKETSFEEADRRDVTLGINQLYTFLLHEKYEQTLIEKE